MDLNEGPAQGQRRPWPGGTIALVVALVVLAIAASVAIFRDRGPAVPLVDPDAATAGATADPLAALEKRTRDNPQDGEAWSALANGYFEAGRFDAAIGAFSQAAERSPRDAALWSGRGEARVMASVRDPMPEAAVADFRQAIALDPRDPRARYFLAVRRDLDGDHQGAIADWLALLADTPPGAPWEADLRRTIEQVGKINGIAVAEKLAALRESPALPSAPQMPVVARAIPGPSAEDLQRATAMRPDEQRAMAEGMVARLEARLRDNPANVDGWIMLIRSRTTLGQADKAAQALKAAIAANPGKTELLRQQAGVLGVR